MREFRMLLQPYDVCTCYIPLVRSIFVIFPIYFLYNYKLFYQWFTITLLYYDGKTRSQNEKQDLCDIDILKRKNAEKTRLKKGSSRGQNNPPKRATVKIVTYLNKILLVAIFPPSYTHITEVHVCSQHQHWQFTERNEEISRGKNK